MLHKYVIFTQNKHFVVIYWNLVLKSAKIGGLAFISIIKQPILSGDRCVRAATTSKKCKVLTQIVINCLYLE